MTSHDDGIEDDLDDELDEDPATMGDRETVLAHITQNGFLRVVPQDVLYAPGSYVAWNGVKGGGPRGYGWDSRGLPSEFYVVVMTPTDRIAVRIDRTFKQTIGRLSPKRRELIKRAMPAELTLVKGDDPWYGKENILVSNEDLVRWVDVVKTALAAEKRAKPKSRAG